VRLRETFKAFRLWVLRPAATAAFLSLSSLDPVSPHIAKVGDWIGAKHGPPS
jgi:hypothetical protein